MIKPTSISEQLLFSTVRIVVELASGEQATGTGFFFNFLLGDKKCPAIITNKHVISGAKIGQFQLHESDNSGEFPAPSGKFFTVNLDEFEKRWIFHPNNDVDLCALLFEPLRVELKAQGKSVFAIFLDESIILPDSVLENLSAVEEVLMVGYPNGLWDNINNLPIIRRGITATHPAIDFQGKTTSVIDAACFPGSSGSPVLVINEGSYQNKLTPSIMTLGNRIILLGILYAGPQMTLEGQIVIKEIPTVQKPISLTNVMLHLGYIVKAKEIKVLAEFIKQLLQASGNFS